MKNLPLALLALTVSALFINTTAARTTPHVFVLGDDPDCAGITMNNTLVFFSSQTPEQVISEISLVGLLSGENIVAIEFVPALEMAFGYSNRGRLYKINLANGMVVPVGFDPPFSQSETVSMLFDSASSLIRTITSKGSHFAVSSSTGNIVRNLGSLMYQDGDPNSPQTPQIEAAALPFTDGTLQDDSVFDSAFPYLIDSKTNSLGRLGKGGNNPAPADSGKIITVGQLSVNISSVIGFDISRDTNAALAALVPQLQSSPKLFKINLVSGLASEVGTITPGKKIIAFTTTKAINNAFAFFDPSAISGVPGQEKTVTVKVYFNGKRVAGINVEFSVIDGPSKGTQGNGITDNNGVASFKYKNSGQVGTDTVLVNGQASSISFSSMGKVFWEDRPLISEVQLEGKNVLISGLNFKNDDQVFINSISQIVKFRGAGTLLIAKKGKKFLLECTDGTPKQNIIRVLRNPLTNPQPVQDTTAFATCP